jgi:hypothetical protein
MPISLLHQCLLMLHPLYQRLPLRNQLVMESQREMIRFVLCYELATMRYERTVLSWLICFRALAVLDCSLSFLCVYNQWFPFVRKSYFCATYQHSIVIGTYMTDQQMVVGCSSLKMEYGSDTIIRLKSDMDLVYWLLNTFPGQDWCTESKWWWW